MCYEKQEMAGIVSLIFPGIHRLTKHVPGGVALVKECYNLVLLDSIEISVI